MSGLFGSLSSGVQALNAQAKGIEVSSKNLANVNNPDYARQRVQFGDRGTVMTAQGPQSLGTEAIGVASLRDRLMDSQVIREAGLTGALHAESRALQQAEATLGENIDSTDGGSGGIGEPLTELFAAFYNVANNPTDVGERQTLVTEAGILADRLNVTDQRLADLQQGMNEAVDTDIAAANDLLETIADLNGQIGRFEIDRPGAAVDLRDQRQAALEKLGNYINFETRQSPTEAGQIDVIARDASGDPVTLVELATVPSQLSFDGSTVGAGDPPADLTLTGGTLKGHLAARDGAIADLRLNLNALAEQLVTAVNGVYNPDGTAGSDFFDPGGTTAGSIALDSGLTPTSLRTSASGISGDNDLVTALGDLGMKKFATADGDVVNGSLLDHYAASVSDLGNSVSGTRGRLEDQSNIETLVRNQRDAVSGVSLDEEMVELMKYQRAFEASARVVSMIDDMLDVIVNRLAV